MVDRGTGYVLSTTLEDKSQHTTCAFKTAIADHALKLVLGFVVGYTVRDKTIQMFGDVGMFLE